MEYVRDRRLRWTDLDAKGLAFEDPGVYMVSFSWMGTFCLNGLVF